ncbi:hypothetical protein JCM37172_05840 [Faecalimonas hominis]
MENRFYIQYARFHSVEKNKFLICGYWHEGSKKNRELLISLDYTALEVEVQKQKTIKTPKAYMEQGECEEKVFYWITLPKGYEAYGKLRVFERKKLDLQEIFCMDTGTLRKLENRVEMNIDEIAVGGTGLIVRGWCIAKEAYSISINGNLIEEEQIAFQRRPDVERVYPECEREWIHGFVVETREKPQGKLLITVQCDGKIKSEKRSVSQSLLHKGYRKLKEIGFKSKVYYQQFGIKRTIRRGMEKLTKKERATYETFRLKYFPNKKQLEMQRKTKFAYEPEFSIVVPLYKTPLIYLEELIQSIEEQTYPKWQLYLSDGSGEDSPLREKLRKYEKKDRRIHVIENNRQLQISENTNEALKRAEGDFIVFADHDDMLSPDALYECAKAVNEFPETEVIYTDEDKVSMDGKEYYQPHFKPDFNIDLLRSANYMCHLYVVKRTLFEKVGYLRSEYNGSQDYDFILRCVEQTKEILHIPKILYHWRIHPNSVAGNPDSKSYAYDAGRNAILAHYKRVGIDADIEFLSPGFYHSIYHLKEEPLVSIIIPNKDHVKDLDRCIKSIQEKSDYQHYEIVIVENNSEEAETWGYYSKLTETHENICVYEYKGKFNYSAIQNFAVQKAKGEYLLLLNNDTWLDRKESIREMLGYCMRSDVGIVGAKLLYPDNTVQHAGVIVGLGGVAGHAFVGEDKNAPGYFCRMTCVQNYSAVTAACMMVKKAVYEEAGGMDTELQVAFNDTDFCLRVGEKGYLVVYNPFAVWYHDESKTRGLEDTEEKIERFRREIEYFQRRWKVFLEHGDANYNPNLALDRHDFSLRS